MKDLGSVTEKEQEEFFNSFDYVFCDVDGVLWHLQKNIPGALEAIETLKSRGKKIIYVSNNSTKSQEVYYDQLIEAGFKLAKSDLIRPPIVMIDFLKNRNFSKGIYLIGMTPLQTELENAGFKIEKLQFENPEESVPKYLNTCLSINKEVGAVIADLDLNMTMAQLQRGAIYLKNPEVIFITGGSDKELSFGSGKKIIGPGCYHHILEDITGRKPFCLAKPSPDLNRFIKEKFKIDDSSKILFIGDSIPEDMGFAANSGHKKLLVLSGLTTEESIHNWTFPEEYKPDFYVESLKTVYDVLSKIKPNKPNKALITN